MEGPVPWEQVAFLARAGETALAAADLGRPGRVDWPQEPGACQEALERLRSALPEGHRPLVDLSVLSSLLLCPERLAAAALTGWAGRCLPAGDLLGVGWHEALAGRWTAAPVPVVQGGDGRILHFLVAAVPGGDGPPLPGWAREALDEAAAAEVGDAFGAARTLADGPCRLVAVPLTVAATARIRRHSLGLPVALAALSALTGDACSPLAVATGDVSLDGAVWGIDRDSLEPKALAASRAGFSLLLFPSSCPHLLDPPEGLEVAGVGNLAQAWRWARLYTPGGARDLNCLEVAMENPRCFVVHCRGLSAPLLAWCREQRVFDGVDPELLADSDFVRTLSERLESCLVADPPDLEAAGVLASLLPLGPGFDDVAARWPAAAFRWCSARYAVAAFLGRRDEAEEWARRTETLAPAARVADPDAYARFVARRVRFGVWPGMSVAEIPAGFGDLLARRRAIQRLRGGVDPLLGELHEAFARHLGFQGRTDDALRHLDAARQAFGNGEVPDWRGAWRRQHGWLAFALLDAGDLKGAEQAVLTCVGAGDWHGVAADPAAVSRHLVPRFLVDAWPGEEAGPPRDTVAALLAAFRGARVSPYPPSHLWAYNVGRLELAAGRPDRAREAWRRSAELCRSFQDPPVSSLLPLAALAAQGPLAPDEAAWAAEGAGALGRQGDLPAVLARVHSDPARFFPFDSR